MKRARAPASFLAFEVFIMRAILFPSSLDADASANGRAFEHACLAALAAHLTRDATKTGAQVVALDSPAARTAFKRFTALTPSARQAYQAAARAGTELLAQVEPTLRAPPAGRYTLALQIDAQGVVGDVRDVVVRHDSGWEIGILVKHNNDAAKHPRLSGDLDFAAHWLGAPASRDYFLAVRPVFAELAEHAAIGSHWDALGLREAEKAARFYRPVLAALAAELRRQAARSPQTAPALLRYMTGRRDFYKLIATIKARRVELRAFCFDGELGRPAPDTKSKQPEESDTQRRDISQSTVAMPRLHTPTQLLSVDFKPASQNTLIVRFDREWSLSLRLHSASSRIERSLKLDARLISTPANMLRLNATWQP